ncbi:uncharacterized protein [Drosophila virilis]|uniref:Uncharacterized protein n=1 Tax=Drosophila virilis TaxID=7244 RepID=B4ME03_DROVI|nr:uncharacterized protein LOC6635883 [Drosophila virilis]EDW58768.1 uncharacterized protein Dvir_GJ18424 [Drosophila virilis]
MEHVSQNWHLLALVLLLTLFLSHHDQSDAAAPNATSTNANTDPRRTVKKDQAPPLPPAQDTAVQQTSAESSVPEKVVVISEKSQQAAAQHEHPTGVLPEEDVHIEHSNMNDNTDFPDTYAAVFYILVGITSSAILVLVVRVYRLRLSRAERKYGVQGDRANQELTPLPMAIEDVNSDEEEDHTLFEVNRQSIRIL